MRRSIFLVLCLMMASDGFAQVRGTSVMATFLTLPNNARTAALGGAGVGSIGSGSAILYNPAGLAFMEGREVYFTYVDWFSDTENYAAGIAANVSRIGTFGLSAVNFDVGFGDVRQYAISGAYGFNITDRIALGTTLEFVRQDFPIYDGFSDTGKRYVRNVFAFDLGAYFATGFRNAVLAMGVENISMPKFGETDYDLPKNIRLGVLLDAMSLMGTTPFPNALDLVLDVNRPNYGEDDLYLDLGVEYTYTHQAANHSIGISLRGGHQSASHKGISWGGGVQLMTRGGRGVKMDYAHKSFRYFGDGDDKQAHILGVALNF